MIPNTIPKIFLFDLDNVLIEAGGYVAGIDAALKYLFNKFHLPMLTDDQRMRVWFEAASVSSEWDMLPIVMAVILDRTLGLAPPEQTIENLPQMEAHLARLALEFEEFDFKKIVQRLQPHLRRKPAPADAILDLILSSQGNTFFPYLRKHPRLVEELLRDSRDEGKSAVNRIFQNFVLGSQVFEEVYGVPAEVVAESALLKYDQPILSALWREKVLKLWQNESIHPVAYTARPSLEPKEVQKIGSGYSPEGEMALSLVGFESMPLIGYGRLQYTARVFQRSPDDLVKPSSFQALAAIKAAWSGNEWQSLQWALQVFDGVQPEAELSNDLPPVFELHVFEDTAGGISAARRAAEQLCALGCEVEFSGWGIATGAEKTEALHQVGVPVFADINAALERVIGNL